MKSSQRQHRNQASDVRDDEERPYHHGNLRRALLDAALVILETEGAAALSLREAARRAGVSHAAPYRHFADKEALLAAVAEESFRALTAAMRARMSAHAPGTKAELLASGVGYVTFAIENPARYRVIFGPASGLDSPADAASRYPELRAAGDACFGVLTSSVAACQKSGALRAGDANELALACWSMVHGLASLLGDCKLPRPPTREAEEALVVSMVMRLVDGIGVDGPEKGRSAAVKAPRGTRTSAKATPRSRGGSPRGRVRSP